MRQQVYEHANAGLESFTITITELELFLNIFSVTVFNYTFTPFSKNESKPFVLI